MVNAMALGRAIFVSRRSVGARSARRSDGFSDADRTAARGRRTVTAEQSTGQLRRAARRRDRIRTRARHRRRNGQGVEGNSLRRTARRRAALAGTATARRRGPSVADATRVGPVCPQPTDPRIPIDLGAPQGDDCLTLNVWASSDTVARRRQAGDGVGARRRLHPRVGGAAAVPTAGCSRPAATS